MANTNKSRRAKVRKIADKKYEVEFVNNLAGANILPPPPPPPSPPPSATVNLTKNMSPPDASPIPFVGEPARLVGSENQTPVPAPAKTPLNLARNKATNESKKRATRRAQELFALDNTATPKPKPIRKEFGVEVPMGLRNSAASEVLSSTNTNKVAPPPVRPRKGGTRSRRTTRRSRNRRN